MTNEPTPFSPNHSADPPDWATISEEIHCPLCGYNLRGLIEPRCPECGYRCEWPDLLDPARRLHPYLFEHHPECNFRSFDKTLLGALRPRRFWKSLHPVQPSNRQRLIWYWLIGAIAIQITLVAWIGLGVWNAKNQTERLRRMQVAYLNSPQGVSSKASVMQTWKSMDAYLDSVFPMTLWSLIRMVFPNIPRNALAWICLVAAWPWLVFLSSLIFTITLRKKKLNSAHLLRCSLYTFDMLTWFAPLMAVFYLGPSLPMARMLGRSTFVLIGLSTGLSLATGISGLYRYSVAIREYLQFPRPVATAFSVILISTLAGLNLFLIATAW